MSKPKLVKKASVVEAMSKPKLVEKAPEVEVIEETKLVEKAPEVEAMSKPKLVEKAPEVEVIEETKLVTQDSASNKVDITSFANRCAEWSKNCKVGDFVYPGGLITDQVQEDIQAAGVVGWRNPDPNASIGQRGLIVCRLQALKAWSDAKVSTGTANLINGWDNTQALLRLVKEKGWSFPAAEWCAAYAKNGIKAGEAFLAASGQLEKIFANSNTINSSLAKIGANVLYGCYWSSSEMPNGSDYARTYGGFILANERKLSHAHVMCVVAF